MRFRRLSALLLFVPVCLLAQSTPPPQTARQALIEMFFGSTPNHLEKHLPDVTLKSFQKLDSGDGRGILAQLSMLSAQAKAGGVNLQTFDTGPALVTVDDKDKTADHVEISVERDDLAGDEDQIELALHVTRNGKEEALPLPLPVIPRFTFSMKTQAEVWRLTEIALTVRAPLADPDFLKNIEDRQRAQNEQMTFWSLRTIVQAEAAFAKANGKYSCTLSALARKGPDGQTFLLDSDLASGKRGGYVYAISNCEASHYKLVAEPAVPDSGQKSFCSDESGTIRGASDGKGTTCITNGEVVDQNAMTGATGVAFSD